MTGPDLADGGTPQSGRSCEQCRAAPGKLPEASEAEGTGSLSFQQETALFEPSGYGTHLGTSHDFSHAHLFAGCEGAHLHWRGDNHLDSRARLQAIGDFDPQTTATEVH